MTQDIDAIISGLLRQLGMAGISVEGAGKGSNGGFQTVRIDLEQHIDQEIIDRAISANDDSATVILLSIEIEQQLNLFFKKLYEYPKYHNKFDTLIAMLRSLRFENNIYEIVDGFRKLRNKFAHEKSDLASCSEILEDIFSYDLPSLTGRKIEMVDGVILQELSLAVRLQTYARMTILFLAGAHQVYAFPKPQQRFVIFSSGETGGEA